MNPNIDAELQQLKVYLDQYPHEAAQLAVNHLEDYLILFNECQCLEDQIRQLRQSNQSKVNLAPSNNTQLTLENRLRLEILKRNLASEPNYNQAKFWAVEYFKFFLHLNESYLEKRAELNYFLRPTRQLFYRFKPRPNQNRDYRCNSSLGNQFSPSLILQCPDFTW